MNGWNGAQRLAVVILASALLVVGIYDLYAMLWLDKFATVSMVVLSVAREHPVLPFLAGLLAGHLFWPQ